MRWSDDRILTTHAGSLPRPPELVRLYARRAGGEAIDPAELEAAGRAALRRIVPKQIEAGIDVGNNGEQQREGFFLYVQRRMSGFGGSWQRRERGDVARYPIFQKMLQEQQALRTAVSNFESPKAIGEVRYLDPAAVNAECLDFQSVLDGSEGSFVEPFLTAPSPGIVAAAMKNVHYHSEEAYLAALADALRVLVEDPPARRPFPPERRVGVTCRDHCMAEGLVMRAVRDVMVLAPPLIISEAEIDAIALRAARAFDRTAADLGI